MSSRYVFVGLILSLLIITMLQINLSTAMKVPSGILYYSNITLQNSQSDAALPNTQLMLPINASSFQSYEASNMQNVEIFNTTTGTVIASWLEGNVLNEYQMTNLNTVTNIIYWIKYPQGIPATTTVVNAIAIGFASISTNLFDGITVGEAPQLSRIYAQYDNGPNVFNFYDDFAGNHLNLGLWDVVSSSYTINDGITITALSANPSYIESIPTFSSGNIVEAYGTVPSSGLQCCNFGSLGFLTEPGHPDDVAFLNVWSGAGTMGYWAEGGYYSASQPSFSSPKLMTMETSSTSTTQYFLLNYTSIGSGSHAMTYPASLVLLYTTNDHPFTYLTNFYQWVRVRSYPPSGVMPSVSFSPALSPPTGTPTLSITPNPSTYGQAITVTATCAISTNTCDIDYPTLGTHIATGIGTATYTYPIHTLAVGTYSSYYANDLTATKNSIAQTLTVLKYNPSFCGILPQQLAGQIVGCISTYIYSPASGETPNNFQVQFTNLPFNALKGNWTWYNNGYDYYLGQAGVQYPCWAESANTVWCQLQNWNLYFPGGDNQNFDFALGPPGTSFWSANVGEAPQLSPSYGEWDNGNNVFAFYDNFNGVSLSTKWQTLAPAQVTVNNGLAIASAGPAYWVNTNTIYTSLFASNIVFTSLAKTVGPGGVLALCNLPTFSSCSNIVPIPTSSQFSLVSTNNIGLGSTYNSFLIDTTDGGGNLNAQYVRATLYPPSGIMPTVSYGSPITIFAPVYLQNSTENPAVQFPSLVGIPACTANTLAGTCSGNDVITGTGALKSNVYVFGNIIVSSGSTLTTNGFGMFTTGTFNSIGATIKTGQTTLSLPGGSSAAGGNVLISYGGSGGGGGGAYTSSTTGNGANGGNTIAAAGLGGIDNTGGNGNTPAIPALTSVNAIAYCNNPSYLTGASGGGGAGIGSSGASTGGTGGYGAYGICIEANTLRLGTITANGITGSGGSGGAGWSYGGGGGGGGGRIILIYGTGGYTAGTYNILGAAGESGGSNDGTGYTGGTGGSGNVIVASGSLLIPIVSTQLYPLELYTSNPSLTYTLNSVVGGIQTTLQSSNTLAYVPPANQATGIYNYSVAEWNGIGTYIIPINISINMTDITSPLVFNGICALKIQDGVNCAKAPTFDTKVSQWNIKGDNPLNGYANGNYVSTGNNLDAWSNANLTFMPNVILTYFQFSPVIAFPANIVNNPSLTAITQNAMAFIASNTGGTSPYTRKLINISAYGEKSDNPLNATTQIITGVLVNNYTIPITSNVFTANNFQVLIANSLYVNPNVALSNISSLSTKPGFFQATNNYCPMVINSTSYANFMPNLVDTVNGSQYTFQVYQGASGYGGYNDTIIAQTGISTASLRQVQSYLIRPGGVPFALPLIVGAQYRFVIENKNCVPITTTPLNAWTNPVQITIAVNTTVPPLEAPYITAMCVQHTAVISGNPIAYATCQGYDSRNFVSSWNISVYKSSILTPILVNQTTIAGPSFFFNWTQPNLTAQYNIHITAVIDGSPTVADVLSWFTSLFANRNLQQWGFIFGIFLILVCIFGTGYDMRVGIAASIFGLFIGQVLGFFNLTVGTFWGMALLGIIIIYYLYSRQEQGG